VPFYDAHTAEQVGVLTNEATVLGDNECLGTAVYSFTLGPYAGSQISTSTSCAAPGGESITGGVGMTGCAAGTVVPVELGELLFFEINTCGQLCPIPTTS